MTESIRKRLGTEVEQRKIKLDNRLKNGANLHSDKDKLKLILVKLVYHAVTYCPVGSSIVIDLHEPGTGLSISISNKTVGLTEHDRLAMFERLCRKEQVQTPDSHAGLGLSLVKAPADLLNLRVKPVLAAGTASRFYGRV